MTGRENAFTWPFSFADLGCAGNHTIRRLCLFPNFLWGNESGGGGGDKERGYLEIFGMLPGCIWSKRLRCCSLQGSSSYSWSVMVCGSESGGGQRVWVRGANAQLWRQRDEKSGSKIRGSINRLPGSARMFGCDCGGNKPTQPGPWAPATELPIVLQGQRDRVGVSEHTWAEDSSIFHTKEPAGKAPRLSAE